MNLEPRGLSMTRQHFNILAKIIVFVEVEGANFKD